MRIGKKKSIGQLLIDLTPLLDVVFILLIVVLCFQNRHVTDAEDKVEASEQKVEVLSAQLTTYKNEHDYINVITVSADYTPSDRTRRTIRIVINDEMTEKALDPSNKDSIWEECKELIEGCVESKETVPTICIYDIGSKKTLYRDEKQIGIIFKELENKYSNVYFTNHVVMNDE